MISMPHLSWAGLGLRNSRVDDSRSFFFETTDAVLVPNSYRTPLLCKVYTESKLYYQYSLQLLHYRLLLGSHVSGCHVSLGPVLVALPHGSSPPFLLAFISPSPSFRCFEASFPLGVDAGASRYDALLAHRSSARRARWRIFANRWTSCACSSREGGSYRV